jgi:hypothetical protein
MLALFAELELRTIKSRSAAALARRRARGDRMGTPLYGTRHEHDAAGRVVAVPDPAEPVEPILEAYREAGSVLGAARLLSERGIPSPTGRPRWGTDSVTRILEANAPELLPHRTVNGKRLPTSRTAPLAGLLRCGRCGHFPMTPNLKAGQYYCWRGHRAGTAAHGLTIARVAKLMPWVQAEAARLRTPERVQIEAEDVSRREAIAARLERAHELYIAGDVSRERYEAEKARITADLEALESAEEIVAVPPLDWSWPPAQVNSVLRALWSEIRLDADMRPVEAVWRVPDWRAP